jgi:hypothetical protein
MDALRQRLMSRIAHQWISLMNCQWTPPMDPPSRFPSGRYDTIGIYFRTLTQWAVVPKSPVGVRRLRRLGDRL